jgi:TonB-linked SusC/RagA family outer membrane protein
MKKIKKNSLSPREAGTAIWPVGTVLWRMRRRTAMLCSLCVCIFMLTTQAKAQNITVTGTVKEASGQTMPGVNIIVKDNPSVGTITSDKGEYTLQRVAPDAVLIFSFIGFKTQYIPVEGRTRIDVKLEEDITSFPEIVVYAGYYSVKEKERTGSISKIAAKEIENRPVSNVLSAVQGQMAGVNITQGSGLPGGGYKIQIRGTNSLRSEGNYPMYIIDGVPVSAEKPSSLSGITFPDGEINPLNAINPNDIESIEVLKDADATAIYGSRGANGVILITTRKGKGTDKTRLSVNTSYGISNVAGKMNLMNTEQYLGMRRQAYANDEITSYPANAYDVNGTWDQTRYTDWQKELIGNTATNKNVQVSLSGGSENTSFLLSGSHNEQTTVYSKNFKYTTNNLSGNLTHHSVDNRFTLNASGLFSAQSNNLVQNDITSQVLRLIPDAPALYAEDGSLNWENNTFNNPVAAYECTYSYKSKILGTDINLQYELFPAFNLKLNGGLNYVNLEDMLLNPSTMYNPSFGITPASSLGYKGENQRFSYLFEPQLNFIRKFGDHRLDILVGSSYQQSLSTSLSVLGYGFESNALITNLSAASTVMIDRDLATEYRYAAFFGRINYQYKGRYIINLTGRRDGSSRFGPDNRFASFGAIGAAWMFSQESFLKESKILSFGKLRASYGLTGSDLIGDYQYLDTYTVSSTLYGGSTSLYPSRLFNPYFSWEKTTKIEIAIELGFLQDRLHFNAAWYRNRSGNQLVGIQLPATTGFSRVQSNLPAIVENTGLELELNATPVDKGQFRWNSSFNISFPRNKLVEFPGLEGSSYANTYVVGCPVSIVKVYNYEGINPETGLYTFTDYNSDGKISSPQDNLVIKETGVKYFGGWSNRLSYKQWEFSFLLQFVNQTLKNFNSMMSNPGSMNNQPVEVLDVWSEANPGGKYMPYTSGINTQKNKLSGYFRNSTSAVGDASFIRLKNIQMSYSLPVKGFAQDLKLFVQGQNLLTLTGYFGLDPEFVSSGFLPPLKTWSFGIQVNF